MTRLGITRQISQLDNITRAARNRGVEVVPLPLTKARYLEFSIDDSIISRLDWIFFTSANGVRSFFDRLRELDIWLTDRTKIGAVGKKTSKALAQYDLKTDFVPREPYGKKMFLEYLESVAARDETVLFARAKKIAYDPEQLFHKAGIKYYSVVGYETVENDIPDGEIALLTATDYILYTAPSAVRSYQNRFGKPVARSIAIGRTTAEEMKQNNWEIFKIMDIPDVDLILDYVEV